MAIEVSIIIPCFNRVDLLKLTLKSVEAAIKTISAEVIIVDDGSDIPIEDQITDFKHLPIKFIRQNNSGLNYSKYIGLINASGDYIQFLDSDDQITEDKLTVQISQMKLFDADVSHTDLIECHLDYNKQTKLGNTQVIPHSDKSYEFYIKVQPAPHSPVYKKDYLIKHLTTPFIALSRDYDSIGEIWYYYNLSVFPAKIIKINQPLTVILHHDGIRLTNYWERLGLAALSLQKCFSKNAPNTLFSKEARKFVAIATFNTFRGLPYNISIRFQYAFVKTWKELGKCSVTELNGGKNFTFSAKILGPVLTSIVLKLLLRKNYKKIRTISLEELNTKLEGVLNK